MSRVKLGDVAFERKETLKNGNNQVTVGLEHLIPEEIELTQWDEGAENTFTKAFHKGDILFGRRRAYLKKAAVASLDGICSGDITVISANEEKISPRLLPFIIQNDAFFDFAVEKSAGSLSPRVKWQHLKEYEFELPDMGKQQELAELLWSMNATKMAYKKLLEKTDELVKSQFIEMFGNDDDSEYLTLEQCCTSVTGGNTPSMKHDEYYGGDIPFIKSGDVKDAYVSAGALWLTQEALEKTTAKYVPKGTVIVVVRSGILKHDLPVAIAANPVVINQDLKAFQPRPEFTSQYLAWAIKSKEDYLLRMTRAMTVDNIESKELFSIPVMVAPLEQQKYFEHFVEQIDKSKFDCQMASNLNLSRCLVM